MVYHVGSPAMFEGNRFLPETGTPIWKMLRRSTVLELCEPLPLTVATWMLMSLTTGTLPARPAVSCSPTSVVAINSEVLPAVTRLLQLMLGCTRPPVGPAGCRL